MKIVAQRENRQDGEIVLSDLNGRKRRKHSFIAVIKGHPLLLWGARLTGLLLTLFLLGVFIFVIRPPSVATSPTQTLLSFCTDLKKGDLQGAYTLFSSDPSSSDPGQAGQWSVADENTFITSTTHFIQGGGGVKDCTIQNIHQHNSQATGTISLLLNKGKVPFFLHWELGLEHNTWKLLRLIP